MPQYYKVMYLVLILSVLISLSHSEFVKPLARIYSGDEKESSDFAILTSKSNPYLSRYYEDTTTIASFCVTGTWIWYNFGNYQSGGVGGLVYSSPNITCAGRMWPPRASMRRIGSQDNIYHLSLTTFTEGGYNGNATTYFSEGNIEDAFSSFVVTGNFPVTMFSGRDLTGDSFCVNAPQNGLGGGFRESGAITKNIVKSFRFGCLPGNGDTHYQLELNFNDK